MEDGPLARAGLKREMRVSERIVSDPRVMMGKPVVRGTRITVESIWARMDAGETIDTLVDAHPRLTREDVSAALAKRVPGAAEQAVSPEECGDD